MGEIEHQRHGATPVGHPEGSRADPFFDDGLNFALDPVAVLARDDPALLDGFAEQPEQAGSVRACRDRCCWIADSARSSLS